MDDERLGDIATLGRLQQLRHAVRLGRLVLSGLRVMTITKDQAQMLATLAAAARPNGARRWDHAGIMAALEKVRDRDLGEVIVATIRAASDRDCETPGVIPSAGSHWQQAATVKVHTPKRIDKADLCGICSKTRDKCPRERVADDDHVFDNGQRDPVDVPRTVGALKDEMRRVAPIAPAAIPTGLDALTVRRPELIAAAQEIASRNPGLRNERETEDA